MSFIKTSILSFVFGTFLLLFQPEQFAFLLEFKSENKSEERVEIDEIKEGERKSVIFSYGSDKGKPEEILDLSFNSIQHFNFVEKLSHSVIRVLKIPFYLSYCTLKIDC